MNETRIVFEIRPVIPAALGRIEELAADLSYCWDRRIRDLFANLDSALWDACGHNPKVFLRRVSQQKLDAAADNTVFVQDYEAALSGYDSYLAKAVDPRIREILQPDEDLIVYFCAEYGLHESLPLYAGGLGVLAGDHCKAASDLGLPFIAVGLFYRTGYLRQEIDGGGRQQLRYVPVSGDDLPFTEAREASGQTLRLHIDLLGRDVAVRVWEGRLGHIRLLLLDTDLETNTAEDRRITFELYGGDKEMRIAQEIVLGVGGVRALRALGLAPTVWHINEGHAAFMVLERIRELRRKGIDFHAALEVVAAATVFTTHTPVPAGHDVFPHDLMRRYFPKLIEDLGIGEEGLLALGQSPLAADGFNQTALALRGARFRNGVSRVHGGVAAKCESYVWPDIPTAENPVGHVTNGVHLHTYLATSWVNLFDLRLGRQWRNEICNKDFWQRIDTLPDHTFWSIRQLLKLDLLTDVRERLARQYARNGMSPAEITRRLQTLKSDRDVMLIGFARRFATYKRATLLIHDRERLARFLGDDERPVIMLFAGKAHSRDSGGQELIRALYELSLTPQFTGRLFLIEDYDIALARRLVSGVDIWLNTPEYPMEASGTSGMKAAINGAVHCSILDGWWAEGFEGDNGYGIVPYSGSLSPDERDRGDADSVMRVLETEAKPLYYERNGNGYSAGWVKLAKASMRAALPQFNAERQVIEYAERFYAPAAQQARRLAADNYQAGHALADWKRHVLAHWPQVAVRLLEGPGSRVTAGASFRTAVGVRLGDLNAADVRVELQLGRIAAGQVFELLEEHSLYPINRAPDGETVFALTLQPAISGLVAMRVRIYPQHELLAHRFELGRMLWL
ncbi:MAG: alpha-glucan family phosphorylase [Gammaproteobacteria bacterium]|nr:alpha-glucan family phosphorylase [Gammaproteobacteria bacterium]MBI5616858.1 alpha-glucan family phosphorylase [Gammaproteobacteria bacterium]